MLFTMEYKRRPNIVEVRLHDTLISLTPICKCLTERLKMGSALRRDGLHSTKNVDAGWSKRHALSQFRYE